MNKCPKELSSNVVKRWLVITLFFLTHGSVCDDGDSPYFRCKNGTDVSLYNLCLLTTCLPSVDITKFCERVFEDRFRCLRYKTSIPHNLVCDGISHCQLDGSDENPTICGYRSCPENKYYCLTEGCIDISKPCSNISEEDKKTFILSPSDHTIIVENEEIDTRCGRSNVVPLILHGSLAKKEDWPWHVSLYTKEQRPKWEVFCAGSLMSTKIVLTAGHCIWERSPESIKAALGKGLANFNLEEPSSQIKNIHKIIPNPLYQDAASNYASDIGILVLIDPVRYTEYVRPVCMDWRFRNILQEISLPAIGFVSGMGITENDTVSDQLRSTTLSIVGSKQCLESEHFDFKRYVSFTSFCAGWINGSNVCNGDSGGGLVIEINGTLQLEGIVSVSPKRPNTFFCDNRFYALFTKVGIYTNWIRNTMISEGVDSSLFF